MAETASEYWADVIAAQESSGQTVRGFCRERRIGEHSFYVWRKRLRRSGSKPVKFALVETKAASAEKAAGVAMEIDLADGTRLRVSNGADPSTVRAVWELLGR